MKSIVIGVAIFVVLASLVAACERASHYSGSFSHRTSDAIRADDTIRYQSWRAIPKELFVLSGRLSNACGPGGGQSSVYGGQGPHDRAGVRVFLNPTAEAAIAKGMPSQFPVGTIIVKEKWDPNGTKPAAY